MTSDLRLLVVEDEPKLASNIRRGLEEAGYGVVVAPSVEVARESLNDTTFNLMLLDLRLPGQSGLEFLRELRAAGSTLPVLILTALDSIDDRVIGLDGGADDYLSKPFSFEELLARIRALLRRPLSAVGTTIEVGELRLDSGRRLAWRRRRALNLSPKELMLLEYMMRHAGVVLSRDLIGEAVWGEDYNPLSNIVEVFVNRLRQKVDEVRQPSMIATARGTGYMLKVDVSQAAKGGGAS